jgi:hypothetical protein
MLGRALLLAGGFMLVAGNAEAYVTKRTASGAAIRWDGDVELTLDRSLEQAGPNGLQAVEGAARAWGATAGAPTIKTVSGEGATVPAQDGKNTILYVPGGYGPAGKRIAVTVITYELDTGHIVDADVVFNGKYKGYDVGHIAAHEIGHVLGLGDENEDRDALMFGYSYTHTMVREPTEDDRAGIRELYADRGGCNASGAQPAGLALIVAMLLATRLRRARALVVVAALFAASAEARATADVTVVASRTGEEAGLFKTTLTLDDGRELEVWGGEKNGLAQQIGEEPVPRVGARVRLLREARTFLAQDIVSP